MRLIVIFCILFTVLNLNAQQRLIGKVFIEGKGPVTGAQVSIPDLNKSVLSDSAGNYSIDNIPKGEFLVECKALDKYYVTQTIAINGTNELVFRLEETVLEIQELTVTGSSQSELLRQNPVAMQLIDQQKLFENSSSNLIEAIAKEPGVSSFSTGAAISKPVIRGLGFNRIVTLQNGMRQEGQQWGEEHGIEIDEFSVEKVEIIKGPGSLMYGSDALAGVINFISADPLPSGKIKTTFTSGFHSNNKLQSYSLMNGGTKKGFTWNVRGTYKLAANYHNAYDGYVHNTGFEEKDASATVGLIRKWGFSTLQFSTFNQHIAMPEGERDSTGKFIRPVYVNDSTINEEIVSEQLLKAYRIDLPAQRVNHNRMLSTTRVFGKKANYTLKLAAQRNNRREFADLAEPENPELFFQLSTFNYDFKINFNEVQQWKFSIGSSGMAQQNRNLADERIIPDYNLNEAGVYALFKKSVSTKLVVSGGVRFDNRSIHTRELLIDSLGNIVENNGVVKFAKDDLLFQAFTGALGMTYEPLQWFSIKANLARGFRSPTVPELSSNGKHEGALRYEIGNPDLKPETSLQADLGLDVHAEHISLELSGFYNSIQQFIYSRKLSAVNGGDSIVDFTDPAPVFQFVQGNADLFGGEFFMDIHPHPFDWLHLENSFSLVYGSLRNQPDSMINLPFIPAQRYEGVIRCEFPDKGKTVRDAFFAGSFQYYFKQDKVFTAYDTETATESYSLVNLSAGCSFYAKGKNRLTVLISVNNLFDVAYQHHLSRLKYAPENLVTGRTGIFNMGRNIAFKLIIPLETSR